MNHESLLMDTEYFDVCSGALVSDIMHDLLEGLLPYETKLLLNYFIENNYFTLQNLNNSIASMELPYGTESDRPSPINNEILRAQGSQLNQKGSYICKHIKCKLN